MEARKQVMKTAIITGVLGQDGSYLAEYLLSLDYYVVGISRRKSTDALSYGFLEHLKGHERFELVHGDITDPLFITEVICKYYPDEFYSLAAQSHVGHSFTNPAMTFQIDAASVVNILSLLQKHSPSTKFYQASTSELFGGLKCPKTGYTEDSLLHPRSPYGVAKLAAHWSTINFREAYGMYACAGLLFNHECLTEQTPIIIKDDSGINILPIEEVVTHRKDHTKGKKYSSLNYNNLYVWDGGVWTKIKTLTATWNDSKDDKNLIRITSRGGFYEATSDHLSFLDNEIETKTSDLKEGDFLQLKKLPQTMNITSLTLEEAEFLGLMCADGSITEDGKGKFINKNQTLIKRVEDLWLKVSGGSVSYYENESGYKKGNKILNLNLNGNSAYLKYLRDQLYTESKYSKIPKRILNAGDDVKLAFLRGFNLGDGTKTAKKSEFQCFTMDSQTLALGLWYLIESTLGYRMTLHVEERNENQIYYKININSSDTKKGNHLIKDSREIKKITKLNYTGWVFDLETESGTFSAGIGNTWVHNSPRRGLDFVTRKVTHAVARIKLNLQESITMGNIDAYRDWGHSKDYVKAMHLMLQQETPKEYVIATGEAYSIKDLLEATFLLADLGDYEQYIKFDEKFMRPSEVDYLKGNPSKAKKELNWKPEYNFYKLIEEMYLEDLKNLKR